MATFSIVWKKAQKVSLGIIEELQMDKIYYAHSKKGEPPEKWQRLEGHLKNVAEIARKFAEELPGESGCRI